MPKPTFLTIGAMKCGTTSLHNLLAAHNCIFMTEPKEVNYFAYDHLYDRGSAWYEQWFESVGAEIAIGESSTNYTKKLEFPCAAERMGRDLPEAKLIYIVRDPVERMRSHWLHLYEERNGGVPDFLTALEEFPEIIDASLYWQQLQEYRRYYSDDRIHIMFLKDLLDDQQAELARCFDFLGVPGSVYQPPDRSRWNESNTKLVDNSFGRACRGLPGFTALAGRVPIARAWARALLKRQVPVGDVEAVPIPIDIADLLRSDASEFLHYARKDCDYWNLESWTQVVR